MKGEIYEMSKENGVPFQFWMPETSHEKVMQRLGAVGLDLAPFMRMTVDRLIERPIEKSIAELEKHSRRKNKHNGKRRV